MRAYTRPPAPDMLPNGMPDITVRRRYLRSSAHELQTEPDVNQSRSFPWRSVALGAGVLLCISICWTAIVMPWWASMQDQWHYGDNRITQMDANVGHDGECHYLAEYFKGAIVVIEIPYAAKVYTIPVSDAARPVVILNTMKDTQTGRVDLMVRVEGTSFETILYNTGSGFSESQ